MIGSNVFGQAQQYQTEAGDVYSGMAGFEADPLARTRLGGPAQIKAVGAIGGPKLRAVGAIGGPSLAGTNLGQYMSPYTQEVIDRTQQDIARQQAGQLNVLGSQAQTAGAFGGGRHGLAEGAMMGEYGRTFGDIAAQQRQAGYEQALQSAQYDITNRRAALEAAAGRQQQARGTNVANRLAALEAAAARRQGVRSENVAARNLFKTRQAQMDEARRLQNYQRQFDVQRMRGMGAAGLGGIGEAMFGQGMRGLQQQQDVADFAQRQQQMILDAARQQTLANLGYPAAALQTGAGLLAGFPGQSETEQGQMGLVDILSGIGSLPGFG